MKYSISQCVFATIAFHFQKNKFASRPEKNKHMLKRLQRELQEMTNAPPEGISAGPRGDDIKRWDATIAGPPGSPYEGGLFKLTVTFPDEYPFKPPAVRFTTPIFHVNISESGVICIDTLKHNWAPALTIDKVLLSIQQLMSHYNPDSALRGELSTLAARNCAIYDNKAREHTRRYAMPK